MNKENTKNIIPNSTLDRLTQRLQKIMENYNIDDKTELLIPSRPQITVKDHKKNFQINTKVRLICPNKSDSCKLRKMVLDKYTLFLKNKTGLQLWSNTQNII